MDSPLYYCALSLTKGQKDSLPTVKPCSAPHLLQHRYSHAASLSLGNMETICIPNHNDDKEPSLLDAFDTEKSLASLVNEMVLSVQDFTHILNICRKQGNVAFARSLHFYMREHGIDSHASLANYLISMFVDFGMLDDAQQVFDRLSDRNRYSWNALITGYVRYGEPELALDMYKKMKEEDSVHPDHYMFVSLVMACADLKDLRTGEEVYQDISRMGVLERDPFLGSALISMYSKCGSASKVHEIFETLLVRDVVSWTALVAACVENGNHDQALNCFQRMQEEGFSPNSATLVCVLKACGNLRDRNKAQVLHAFILRKGLERNGHIASCLVDTYFKCGLLHEAQAVFDALLVQNTIAWTALISGYADHGQGGGALKCYEQMQSDGVCADEATFVCLIKACQVVQNVKKLEEIYSEVAKIGLERESLVGCTILDAYAKYGLLEEAKNVFNRLRKRDVVSWNALIAGYVAQEHCEEALVCFERMQEEGVCPNSVTFISSFKACGNLGATGKGEKAHAVVAKTQYGCDPLVGCSLVDMYAKCGFLERGQEVFDDLLVQDIVSWNALISGYAQIGADELIFDIFCKMIRANIQPDHVTVFSMLNAFNHAGMVEMSQKCFVSMINDYGIRPTPEHQACMVDLLGRAGQLNDAVAMTERIKSHPDIFNIWHIVLAACKKWGNFQLGQEAFERIMWYNAKDSVAYTSMANIYADININSDAS